MPGPQDIVGKTDYDLSPAFLADQFRLDDEYVLAGKRIVNRIEMVGQPDGLTVWNVTNKIPLVDDDGAVIGTAGITRRLNTPRQDTDRPGSEFGAVLAYMRDHYQAPITNRQLARLAHMSVRAFERKFRGSFHLTPQKYLRKLQMRMASRALGLHRSVAGRGGARLRLFRSKPLHSRIPSPFRPHPSRLSRALCSRSRIVDMIDAIAICPVIFHALNCVTCPK